MVAAGIDPSYRDRLSVALSDREVWAAFRTLLQLRGEPPVAWEEQAVRRGQRRFRLRAERAPLAIPPVLLDGAAPPRRP